eukprot:183567-Prymnesium_polylepis.1
MRLEALEDKLFHSLRIDFSSRLEALEKRLLTALDGQTTAASAPPAASHSHMLQAACNITPAADTADESSMEASISLSSVAARQCPPANLDGPGTKTPALDFSAAEQPVRVKFVSSTDVASCSSGSCASSSTALFRNSS